MNDDETPGPNVHPKIVEAARTYLHAVTIFHRWYAATLTYCTGIVVIFLLVRDIAMAPTAWYASMAVVAVLLAGSVVSSRHQTAALDSLLAIRRRHPGPSIGDYRTPAQWARVIVEAAD